MQQITMENARLLKSEFKTMCEYRQNTLRTNRKFSLENLPLPSEYFKDIDINNQKLEYAVVQGVTENYFSDLNGTQVRVYSDKTTMIRPKVQSDGTLLRDSSGEVVCTTIVVPKGSLAISTNKKLNIPNFVEDTQGVRKKYMPKNAGFLYLTYTNSRQADGNVIKQYYYAIPKEYLYALNYCCLVLSTNPRRAHTCYKSVRVLLQNGSYVYLSVMPLNKISKRVDEQRVVYQALTCNMDKPIRYLCDYWAKIPAQQCRNNIVLTYTFPKAESTFVVDGETVCFTEKVITNAMNELDSALYNKVEVLSIAESQESDVNVEEQYE